jgi:outer membrane protein OmpA-like peptidoglycan-associated protein
MEPPSAVYSHSQAYHGRRDDVATSPHHDQTEALIAKATSVANQSLRPIGAARSRRRWLIPLLATVIMGIIGAGAVRLTQHSRRIEGTLATPLAERSEPAISVSSLAPPAPTSRRLPTAATESTAIPTSTLPLASGLPEPFTFEIEADGRAHMRGAVPDKSVGTSLRAAGVKVLGSAAIVEEYVVDPRAVIDDDQADEGMVTQTLYFPSGLAGLQQEHTADLDVVALVLISNSKVIALVEGYTDSVGDVEQNVALSRARVRRVIEYLSGKGVPAEQMLESVGNSEADPQGDNSTEAGRALIRRVDIHLSAAG